MSQKEHTRAGSARKGALAAIDVERLAKLVRLLASDQEGEVSNTVGAIKRVLAAGGRDLNDFADDIEKDADASQREVAHARREGYDAGYDAGFREGQKSAGDHDLDLHDDADNWHRRAVAVSKVKRLKPHERDFADQMVRLTKLGRLPTERQGLWLDTLYCTRVRKR